MYVVEVASASVLVEPLILGRTVPYVVDESVVVSTQDDAPIDAHESVAVPPFATIAGSALSEATGGNGAVDTAGCVWSEPPNMLLRSWPIMFPIIYIEKLEILPFPNAGVTVVTEYGCG